MSKQTDHRRRLRAAASLAALTLLCSACTGAASDERSEGAPDNALPTVHVDGSNGVMPLMRALADAYTAEFPTARVTFGSGLGSRTRLDSLRAGVMDIAIASHGLDTAQLRAEGLQVHRIAQTPVVIGVHSESVSLAGLAAAQLCDVLAGRVTSWRQLGDGRDLPIQVVVRPESEVDMEVLRDRVPCAQSLVMTPNASVVEETNDMALALVNTVGAIGVTTATVTEQSEGAIRALSLDGVLPTPGAVQQGTYALMRSSYLVIRPDAHAGVTAFLDFIASPSGARVLEENGASATAR